MPTPNLLVISDIHLGSDVLEGFGAGLVRQTSNVDRDLFLETEERIGVRFDEVVTAEDVRSYKPSPAHLHEAMRRLGLGPEEIVHVAQSLHHDVAMAKPLGIRTVWVDRRAGRPGGAVLPADVAADLRVETLAELADLVDG